MCRFLRKVANLRADSWREEVRGVPPAGHHLTLSSCDHRKTSGAATNFQLSPLESGFICSDCLRIGPALKRENCKGPAISHQAKEEEEEESQQQRVGLSLIEKLQSPSNL